MELLMKSFKEFISEEDKTTHTNLVSDFLNSTNPTTRKFYSTRDNCGPACYDLIDHAKSKGINLKLIRGEFKGDSVVHSKKDFTKEMKKEFKSSGLDFNNKEHRKQWIETNPKYSEEWKNIPHYWTKDEKGNIHDPTGNSQIIKKGFSKDLNSSRYTEKQ
jgi:hypothetical protein